MNQIEYFYNIIYYFFYRSAIKISYGLDFILYPYRKLIFLIIDIPIIRKQYTKRGITNPRKTIEERRKKTTENPILSRGTIIGHGFATSVLLFFYIAIYHIFKYSFFPTFQDSFGYVLTVTGILAYSTDIIFTQTSDKDIRYIKEFNKRKGWWRTKWKIITILSLFLSLWFSLTTSSGGNVGQFLISLHSNI
ncbi:hypothetical protein [Arcobacter sp. CECT 8985]|uniref:hypothetical protein n=1 Tax=Arcobacter sp. CECT 8985 TaxID=1935424 RepID=UPI00100B48D8|nr:hypothetical protein [Arcobacter sp. CECT 8985]RXJ84889.1 hypothetical protein CRU93_11990 [Arcobacter sp. CECT 8985]